MKRKLMCRAVRWKGKETQPLRLFRIGLGSIGWGLLTAGLGVFSPMWASEAVEPRFLLPAESLALPTLGDLDNYIPARTERLVLDLSDRRLYHYSGEEQIAAYPVAVGREDWETPTGEFKIFQRVANPTWQHPFTKEIVPPGPDNPLGARWLGFWTDGQNFIGFHGTPNENLIGQAVSHGCVRMRNADIEQLFEQVELGTPVTVRS